MLDLAVFGVFFCRERWVFNLPKTFEVAFSGFYNFCGGVEMFFLKGHSNLKCVF